MNDDSHAQILSSSVIIICITKNRPMNGYVNLKFLICFRNIHSRQSVSSSLIILLHTLIACDEKIGDFHWNVTETLLLDMSSSSTWIENNQQLTIAQWISTKWMHSSISSKDKCLVFYVSSFTGGDYCFGKTCWVK